MKKILAFAVFLILISNLYGDDEDLPRSDCFNYSSFDSVIPIVINLASDFLGSDTNFVERELMKRQPDKIWPTKNASQISIEHTQTDYTDQFGHKEKNSFTVQNAWLHSSWNTRIIKYGLNEDYYHSSLSIEVPIIGRKACNSPWTTVEQAKKWAKWFTHGHEFYDAGIPTTSEYNYIFAANEALERGELDKNLMGTFFDYSEYELTEVVGDMTPNFPERVIWKMKNPNDQNIIMIKYDNKNVNTVDT